MVGSKSASYIFLPILLKICFQQKWYVVGIMYSVEHLGLRWKTAWCFAWPDRLHQNWIRPGRNCGLLGRYETFQLLSSSHFRNWITLPRLYGYQIKSWPNQIWPKQIKLEKKKKKINPEVTFHQIRRHSKGVFLLLCVAVWLWRCVNCRMSFSSWCFFPLNGASLLFSRNGKVRSKIPGSSRPGFNIQYICFLFLCWRNLSNWYHTYQERL